MIDLRVPPRSMRGLLPARFETLESRVLFSGDPAGLAVDFHRSAAVESLDAAVEPAAVPVVDLADRRLLTPHDSARRELIVVDARVPDSAELLAALVLEAQSSRHFELLVLDQASDGIDAIDAALRSEGPLFDAVHVLAHGVDGGMQLGSAVLDAASVSGRGAQFEQWRALLSDAADLLFYSCDIAASDAGMRWLDALATLTGADIAASNDATGDALADADWDLEFRTGHVEGVLFPAAGTWRYTLGANQTTAGVQSHPCVAVDAAGNRVVVWQSEAQDGSSWGVYARRYDAAGTPLGAEFLVNQTTAGDQFDPDVVMDASGAFVVTWTSLGQDGDDATQGNVYGRMFAADGTALGAEFRVNTTTAGDQREAAIGIDNDGKFMIAWASNGQDGSGWGVYARKYGVDGAPLTGEVAINTTTTGAQRSPDVVGDDYGDFIFVWQSEGQDGSGWGIYRTYYASNGNFEGGEKRVNSTTAGDQADPAIGVDANGNWLITWTSSAQDGSGTGIYANYFRYTGNGGNASGEFRVNTTVTGDQTDSAIGYDDARNFVVVWSSSGQDADAPGATNVYAQLLERVGSGVQLYSGEYRVNSFEAGNQSQAAVAMAGDGEYFVVWSGAGPTETTGIDVQTFSNPFGSTAPAVVLVNANLAFLEGDAAAPIDTSLTITDSDSNALVGATVAIEVGFVAGEDELRYTDMLGITGSYNAATGVLSLSGSATVAKYQQALRTVAYHNAAAEPTAGQRRISASVSDGVYTGSDTRGIVVQSVNDAPTLAGANDLVAIVEDASANSGTLVSALIAGKIADADVGSVGGIAVVAVDNTHGTWQYTTDAGAAWFDFGTPSAASARLLTATAGSAVRFVPHANWHGTVAGGLTFRAWDTSTGSVGATGDTTVNGGSSAYSAATAAASIIVGSVNDAPSGADATFVVLEDASRTLSVADFGFTDAADTPGHAFDAIRIAGLPLAGLLTRDGVAVSVGQIVTRADIDAGRLVYAPAANANGAGYASFRFQVCDAGGTSNGGVDLDATPNTIAFDVTPVNDRPVNQLPTTQYVGYNAALVLADANGNAIRVSDPDAGSNAVELTLLALNGTVSLAGTVGLSFTVGDGTGDALMIITGSLASINVALDGATVTPTLNFFGTASLTIGVNDLGASGGPALTDDDTLVLVVAGPLALNVGVDTYSVGEDAVLAAGTVLANDSDPLLGTMSVSEIDGSAAAVGAVHALPSGALLTMNADGTFQYDTNGVYAALAQGSMAQETFTYTVSSTSGRSGVGSVTVTIVGANDAPALAGANDLLATYEDALGGAGTLVSALIAGQATDTDALAARGIAVTGVDETHGTWQFSTDGGNLWSGLGATTPVNARLLLADASTYVRFAPATNWNGTVVAGLTFRAWDATSGAAGGTADTTVNGAQTAFSSTSASASIVVRAVNDAPTGADRSILVAEDGNHVFAAADFGFADGADGAAHGLDAVKIVSTPNAGALRKAGVDVSAGQFVSRAEIDAGLLVYAPGINANGVGYASFTFQVRDDGGTDDGGSDLDPAPDTISFDVVSVNDAPRFTDLFGAVASGSEDAEVVFNFADLLAQSDATDIDGTVNAFVVKAITSGSLRIGTSALTASAYAAGSNDVIDATRQAYWTPATDAWGTLSAVTLTARDDSGRQSVGPVVASVIVVPVADAPSVTPATTHEDTASSGGLVITRNPADGAEVTHFRIDAVTGGTLYLHDGVTPVLSGTFVTAAQGGAGLVFMPAADAVAAGSFTVRGATALNPGALGPDAATASVTVVPVNDAPVLSGLNDLAVYFTGAANAGTSVIELIAGYFADVDTHDDAGIAIVATDEANGIWEYTLDGGDHWDAVAGVNESAALLLFADPAVRVRFVPEAGYLGSASMEVRAWDRTSGVSGARADVSVHGGATAYSAARHGARAHVANAPPAEDVSVIVGDRSVTPLAEASVGSLVAESFAGSSRDAAERDEPDVLVTPRDAPPSSGRAAATANASAQEAAPVDVPIPSAESRAASAPSAEIGMAAASPAPVAVAPIAVMQPSLPQSLTAGGNGIAPPSDVALLGQDFVPQPEKTAEALSGHRVRDALDVVRESVRQESAVETQIAAASVAITGSLSAGYVMWLVRGGVLATSLMSSLPAWRVLDPLPVLSHRTRRVDEDDDDESLETMVEGDEVDDDEAAPSNSSSRRDAARKTEATS